jgi:hypothetical protein
MTLVLNPQNLAGKIEPEELKQHQSVAKTLTGNVDMGTATGVAPPSAGVNAGVATQFNKGNGSGVLIRIAANGVAGTGAPYNWGASGVGIVINHGLLRTPLGWQIMDADGVSTIHRTAAPTEDTITLATSNNAVSNTIYVF